MRTSITILTLAALTSGCDSVESPLHTPSEGEAPTTDTAAFDIQRVFVANDSTSAVPVSATQSGDWNVAVTGPWCHDGSSRSLEKAVARHGLTHGPAEMTQLIAFLEALSDPEFTRRKSLAMPEEACGKRL